MTAGQRLRIRRVPSGGAHHLAVGDRVLVLGPPGEVMGEILQIAAPRDMPQIEGAPPATDVQAILREWHIDMLLLIAHKHEGQDVCFFALRHPGGWRDLRGQDISVTHQH